MSESTVIRDAGSSLRHGSSPLGRNSQGTAPKTTYLNDLAVDGLDELVDTYSARFANGRDWRSPSLGH
jgi:hypothetical protein